MFAESLVLKRSFSSPNGEGVLLPRSEPVVVPQPWGRRLGPAGEDSAAAEVKTGLWVTEAFTW